MFGQINVGAEMAATMGMDPRPYLTEEQIAKQLQIARMTRKQWDEAWELRLNRVLESNREPCPF